MLSQQIDRNIKDKPKIITINHNEYKKNIIEKQICKCGVDDNITNAWEEPSIYTSNIGNEVHPFVSNDESYPYRFVKITVMLKIQVLMH